MKRNIRYTLTIILLLILWYAVASSIDHAMILPMPQDVLIKMIVQIQQASFYISIMLTCYRMLIGLVISCSLGIVIGLLASLKPWLNDYITPITSMIKTIPNISYMIIVLLWFTSHQSVIVIVFLILFPLFYEATKSGIQSIRSSLMDVLKVYSETPFNKLKNVYIPSMLPFVLSNLAVSLNLGFKVAIMAEVLGQPASGIGRSMLISKLTLDMASLFAWTAWIIILGLVFDKLVNLMISYINKHLLNI